MLVSSSVRLLFGIRPIVMIYWADIIPLNILSFVFKSLNAIQDMTLKMGGGGLRVMMIFGSKVKPENLAGLLVNSSTTRGSVMPECHVTQRNKGERSSLMLSAERGAVEHV